MLVEMRQRRQKSSMFLVFGVLVVPCIFAYYFVMLASAYDGNCGGLMPFLAGAKPCSLLGYLFRDALFLALLATGFLVREHWVAIVLLAAVPVALGLLLRGLVRPSEVRASK
jgi:hypothetical protein